MMRNLVYSTAFGKPYYFELAQEMIFSLRRVGYSGEIIILTDRPYHFEGALGIEIDIGDGLWKAAILKAVNPEVYDRILFCDTDIVFTRNPRDIFNLTGTRVAMETFYVGQYPIHSQFLSEAEKAIGGPCLNSGTLVFDGAMASEILSTWEDAWKQAPADGLPDIWDGVEKKAKASGIYELWDQAVLQKLVLSGQIETEFIPKEMVCFPALQMFADLPDRPMTLDTVLIHFCGPMQTDSNKSILLEWMRSGYDFDSRKNLCERISIEAKRAFADRQWKIKLLELEKKVEMLKSLIMGIPELLKNGVAP